MICPKCGRELADGTKFCGTCGTNLQEAEPEVVEAPVEEITEAPVEQAVQASGEETVEQAVQAPVEETVETPVEETAAPGIVQLKKPKLNKKLITVGAAAVAAVAVLVLLISLLFSGGSDNAYVFMSEGDYRLLTNIKKGESIKIDSSRSDDTVSSLVEFSEDGKYVYYYTKYDYDTNTGTLCRAQYGKLKENSSKNSKYIETIAKDVSLGFRFFGDGIMYLDDKGTLCYYDGKEETSIDKDVSAYYLDEDRIVYLVGAYGEDRDLYGVKLSKLDDPVKLASNLSGIYSAEDFDNIICYEYDDDYNMTLYVAGFDKSAQRIVKDVDVLSMTDGSLYYICENDDGLRLYDYVTDAQASADEGVAEPDIDNYAIPSYSYYMIYGDNVAESDYPELYTSCTKRLYWLGTSTWSWSSYSMEDALDVNWGDKNDAIHAELQNFIDKYKHLEDENGYIKVTEEIKADLQKINQHASVPAENKWLWLCLYKEQSGTTYDYDTYYADYDVYYEAQDRIEMRQELKNSENDQAVYSIHCYKDGETTLISDKVLDWDYCSGGVLYNTVDMVTDKLDLEQMNWYSEVQYLFNINYKAQNYVLIYGEQTPVQICEAAAQQLAEQVDDDSSSAVASDAVEEGTDYVPMPYESYVTERDASVYFAGDQVFMSRSNGELLLASVSGGTVGEFAEISDDAYLMSVSEDAVYYAGNMYDDKAGSFGDVYSYAAGKETCLAKDVLLENIRIYEDGVILAYTDRDDSGDELTMIDKKGEQVKIDDEISRYVRLDESELMYICDGDLYRYDGKESTKICSDVDYLWVYDYMKYDRSLYY